MSKLFNIILLGCLAAGVEMELEELDAAPFEIKATANHEDGIYKAGEPIVFSVQLFDNGKVAAGHKLSYILRDHDKLNEEGVITTAETPITLPAKSLQAPGWLFVHFTLLDENGKTVKVKGKGPYGVGALVEPEKFVKGREEPADFDAFWTAQKERLKTVPLKELERVKFDSKNEKHKGFDIYDVKVSCVGDMPVSGYLTIPQGAQPKSLKAVVFYHGAGVRSSIIRCMPGAIVFDVNAHGIINGQPLEFYTKLDKGELADYRHRGCMQRETEREGSDRERPQPRRRAGHRGGEPRSACHALPLQRPRPFRPCVVRSQQAAVNRRIPKTIQNGKSGRRPLEETV